MNVRSLAAAILSAALLFQTADAPLTRNVNGNVLISNTDPAVRITFSPAFKYIGGQRFKLYGVAEAEQHFFVQAGASGQIERFYWLQFEHFLPGNTYTYDYSQLPGKADIDGYPFFHDSAIFSDYAAAQRKPDSDGAKALALLTKAGLRLPAPMARIRMFHLPDSAHRTELMIIYGEALGEKAPVGAEQGLPADEKFPDLAARLRKHVLEGMKMERSLSGAN
jgi:hypothetical protein